jgi:mannosyltransferase OCH1-like enzyme
LTKLTKHGWSNLMSFPDFHYNIPRRSENDPIACLHSIKKLDPDCPACQIRIRLIEKKKSVKTFNAVPLHDRLSIPKVFHRIWVGDKKIPKEFEDYWGTWKKFHPDWEFVTHDESSSYEFGPECQRLFHECRNPSEKSDVLRFFIIEKLGGVYLDTDFEALDNIEKHLIGYDFITAWEHQNKMCGSAFFAATVGHPILKKMTTLLGSKHINRRMNQVKTLGPKPFSDAVTDYFTKGTQILSQPICYPVPYQDRNVRNTNFPGSAMIHWWSHSWEEDWTTISFVVENKKEFGDPTKTVKSLEKILNKNDEIVYAPIYDHEIQTTHMCRLFHGDEFTVEGIKLVRKTLREAPGYAECDFRFKDDQGEWFRVDSLVDGGLPIIRVDQVVVKRAIQPLN